MGSNPVRRNLFHHNLSRRPASGAPGSVATQTGHDGASGLSSRILRSASSEAAAVSSLNSTPQDTGEIVVKDKNGNYKLDMPTIPRLLDNEDGDQMEGVDGGAADGDPATATTGPAGEAGISAREKQSMLTEPWNGVLHGKTIGSC